MPSEDPFHPASSPSHFVRFWRLNYFVPHPEQNLSDESLFQAFTPGLLSTSRLFEAIATWPLDIIELFLDRNAIIAHRAVAGGYAAFPCEIPALAHLIETGLPHFSCICSADQDTADIVHDALSTHVRPVLHITTPGCTVGQDVRSVSRNTFRNYATSVLSYWRQSPSMSEAADILETSLTDPDSLDSVQLDIPHRHHLLTLPNECTLAAVGLTLKEGPPNTMVGPANDPYYAAIREQIDAINDHRRSAFAANPRADFASAVDCIVTAPAVLKHWHKPKFRAAAMSKEQRRALSRVARDHARRPTFAISGDSETLMADLQRPEIWALHQIRADEIRAYSQAVAVAASGRFAPVVRLPPSINDVLTEAHQLSAAAKGSLNQNDRARKVSKVARRLSGRLSQVMPPWLSDELLAARRVKLIADAPLEWLDVAGLPLMLRSHTSRIPATPGNLFFGQAVVGLLMIVPESALTNVLVVRAFGPTDPIRLMLTDAVNVVLQRCAARIAVTYVDVQNRSDLVRALDHYDGAIMIFDGHGRHAADQDIGHLVLPEEDVEPRELRTEARVPPIVVLCACDTHPYSASHATSANGFLIAGATTVVATTLPIGAYSGALFIARLVLRLADYLPILLDRPHRRAYWSEILPGLQRRMYVTEVMHALLNSGGIRLNEDDWIRVSMQTGMAIDTDGDWFGTMIEELSRVSGVDDIIVRRLVRERAYLTDALLHVQLGNPERIVVVAA